MARKRGTPEVTKIMSDEQDTTETTQVVIEEQELEVADEPVISAATLAEMQAGRDALAKLSG